MKFNWIIVFVLLFQSCNEDNSIESSNIIDLSNESKVISPSRVSDILSSLEYIPLDTFERFLSLPDKILILDEHYVFLNMFSTKGVYKFQKNGNFDGAIYPEAGPNIFDIPLDVLVYGHSLSILTSQSTILNYSLADLTYRSNNNIDFPGIRFSLYNNKYYFMNGGGSDYQITVTDSNYIAKQTYLKKEAYHCITPNKMFFKTSAGLSYFRCYQSEIFLLNDQCKLKYQFSFKNKSLSSKELLTVNSNNRGSICNLFLNKKVIECDFHENDNYIILSYCQNNRIYLAFIEKETQKYFILELGKIFNDITTQDMFPIVLNLDENDFIYSFHETHEVNERSFNEDVLQRSFGYRQFKDAVLSNPKKNLLVKFKIKKDMFK